MTTPKPKPATAAERKAAERQRQREQGHRRLELYAPPEHHAQIKAYARQLAATTPQP